MSMEFAACAASRRPNFERLDGSTLLHHSSCSAQLLCFRRLRKFPSLTPCSRASTTGFIASLRLRFCSGYSVAIRRRVALVTFPPPIAGLALASIEREASTPSSRIPEQRAADLLRGLRAPRARPV